MKTRCFAVAGMLAALAMGTQVHAESISIDELNARLGVDVRTFDEADKKEFCGGVRTVTDEMSQQLPIQVDVTTQLVGANSMFVSGVCIFNLVYVIDEESIFEMLQASISKNVGEAVPMDFVQKYYTVGEGYDAFRQGMKQALMDEPKFALFAAVPFVEINARYNIDGERMKGFTVTVGGE